jgi:hypothetical protein
MGEPFTYRDGDVGLRGLLARPAAPNGRAVLVVHEAPGLGDNARRRTRMLADWAILLSPRTSMAAGVRSRAPTPWTRFGPTPGCSAAASAPGSMR